VDSKLLKYREFIGLERRTLKLLRNSLSRKKTLAHTAEDVDKCLYWSRGRDFAFATNWNFNHKVENGRVLLGSLVRGDADRKKILSMSHYVCVTEEQRAVKTVLRKFHFDYVTKYEKKRHPHPRFHLQYGGELTPGMEACGLKDKHVKPLFPWLEGPRIFFWPMTLGLLMNMIFHEFPTEDTDMIKDTQEWHNLVRANERMVLVPFYERCAQLAGKDGVVFSERIYVK